jgi:transcriptional regulator with XRE-family HTH domain
MVPGSLIRAVRRRHGLSQGELARRAGTSQPVISLYEQGHRDPGFETLRKLIEAAGERLQLNAVPSGTGLPQALSPEEHARRLIDVLSLADAVPPRRRSATLKAPRLVSR